MATEAAVRGDVLELWWSTGWDLQADQDWEGKGIPEPLGPAVKLTTIRTPLTMRFILAAWQTIAADRYGPGALMLLNENGVGISGPWPVLGVRAEAS